MDNFTKQLETRHPTSQAKKPKIAWVLTDWTANAYRQENDMYGGIGYYRVVLPARSLRKWFDIEIIGADIRNWGTEDETYTRLGRDYDLIVSKHLATGRMGSNILATGMHYKRKVLVDIDDNYLQMRKDNPAFNEYDVLKRSRYVLGTYLELCNGITVSTEPLEKIYKKHNKNIDLLPNTNDVDDWPAPIKKKDGFIRIGFAGGNSHNGDLDLIIEPIAKILQKYPKVLFEVFGALTAEKAREMGTKMIQFGHNSILERFKITGGTLAWSGYPELFASMGWDIGIAPLTDDPFNIGKSHNKWMEYSMVGAATVASPVYPFIEPIQGVDTIKHAQTGFFATDSQSWFEHLEILIQNEKFRNQMASNAYNYIKGNWQYYHHADKWKKVMEKYI